MALMTTTEAAKYIGYSEITLRNSRASGGSLCGQPTPNFVRVGTRTIRYKKEDLDLWVDGLQAGGGDAKCNSSK